MLLLMLVLQLSWIVEFLISVVVVVEIYMWEFSLQDMESTVRAMRVS